MFKRFFNLVSRIIFLPKPQHMKKVVILFAVITVAASSFGQINKGQFLVGGNVSFESQKSGDDDNSKTTSFQFSPNAGYFFINNLAGGARVSFSTFKEEGEDAFNSFLFAPFVRYYFLPAAQKVNILADASYGLGSMKQGDSESFNQFSVAAGPVVFLSPHTALEFTLQYRSAGGDAYGGDDRLNSFGVNAGFQIHLGK